MSFIQKILPKTKNNGGSLKNSYCLLAVIKKDKLLYKLSARNCQLQLEAIGPKTKQAPKQLYVEENGEITDACKWKDIRISKFKKNFVLSYRTVASGKRKQIFWASEDYLHWSDLGAPEKINVPFFVVDDYTYEKDQIAYFEGREKITYCRINKDGSIGRRKETDLQAIPKRFDEKRISPVNAFKTKYGLLLFYYGYNKKNQLSIGAALVNNDNPAHVLWRSDEPLWSSKKLKTKCYPLGITEIKGNYVFHYKDKKEKLYVVKLPLISLRSIYFGTETLKELTEKERVLYLKLRKSQQNPILVPQQHNDWEANGAFNCAAVHLDDKFHLVYRAVGHNGMSVLGYAASEDGKKIIERSNKPIYLPSEPFEFVGAKKKRKKERYPYESGGGWSGWGGCEDPRLCLVEDDIVMTYTAFNGHQAPGVALTSIKKEDFLNRKWNKWKTPRLISKPGEIQKNWLVFPEKINGKYAILHGISPRIMVDYFDSLDQEELVIESEYSKITQGLKWERFLRGTGSPPIKTKHGWLIFYHAMDEKDPNHYKLGVMLLDLKNPTKIISRYHEPILEPTEHYENDGKPGVVYVCGAVVKGKDIFVYYGGADKVTCVATIKLKDLLDGLLIQPEHNRGKLQKYSFDLIK